MTYYTNYSISILCLLFGLSSCGLSNGNGTPQNLDTDATSSSQTNAETETTSWEPANEAVYNMHVGWNLGNTLDVHGDWLTGKPITDFETGWGQSLTTRAMIHRFKTTGFNAIRVPVTWNQHMDKDDIVDGMWMRRVQEVVDYVIDEGMYCILNIHHDTGAADDVWIRASLPVYTQTKTRYKKLWNQIAIRFKKYDQHLIFEGYNEILDTLNSWNRPQNPNAYKAVNAYAQDFVHVVRRTGGNNLYRNLIVNTYASGHIDDVLDGFVLPTDTVANHLLVEVHDYSPYNFALNEDSPVNTFDEKGAEEIAYTMSALNERFCSKGIPVIIGEFSAVDKNNTAERVKHATCVLKEASKYGIVCFKWMGLLDRRTLSWSEPEIKDAIIKNAHPVKVQDK